jgi:hypothetical protein
MAALVSGMATLGSAMVRRGGVSADSPSQLVAHLIALRRFPRNSTAATKSRVSPASPVEKSDHMPAFGP